MAYSCGLDSADEAFIAYFPLAWLMDRDAGIHGLIRERGASGRAFGYTERHLHSVWYDETWRPREFVTSDGETVRVEYPGRWNLEAGPDFIGATLVIGPNERRITGDVEIPFVSLSERWLGLTTSEIDSEIDESNAFSI